MAENHDDPAARPIDRLIAIMARLRDPERGCPWDTRQDFASIAPYTIEEAYEVADAIARGDMEDLRDELGDLLLQVVFHGQMAAERDLFDFEAVAGGIADKLVRRHPHVFADGDTADADAVKASWEAIKAAERAEKAQQRAARGAPAAAPDPMAEVPVALPALTRAEKIQKKAARFGFDWPHDADGLAAVKAKVVEELDELDAVLAGDGADRAERATEEFGDLLFALVNFARRHGIDAETALRRTNDKFVFRFRKMIELTEVSGDSFDQLDLEAQDALWREAKRAEAAPRDDR